MTELRGAASLPTLRLDQRLESLRVVDRLIWNKAQQREAVIRDALQGDGSMTTRVDAAAKTLGLSARTVRRFITRYTASAQTTSLIDHLRGPNKSHRRLGPDLERIIDTAIQTPLPGTASKTDGIVSIRKSGVAAMARIGLVPLATA